MQALRVGVAKIPKVTSTLTSGPQPQHVRPSSSVRPPPPAPAAASSMAVPLPSPSSSTHSGSPPNRYSLPHAAKCGSYSTSTSAQSSAAAAAPVTAATSSSPPVSASSSSSSLILSSAIVTRVPPATFSLELALTSSAAVANPQTQLQQLMSSCYQSQPTPSNGARKSLHMPLVTEAGLRLFSWHDSMVEENMSRSSFAFPRQQQQQPAAVIKRPKLVRVDVYCQLEGYLEQLRPLINPRLLQRFHLDEYHTAVDKLPNSPKANGAILTLYSSTDRWKERLNNALVDKLNELYAHVCLVLLKPVSDPTGLSYIGSKGKFVAIKQLCVSEEGVYDIPHNRRVMEEVLHLLEPRDEIEEPFADMSI